MMKFYPNFLPDAFIETVLKRNEEVGDAGFRDSDGFWQEDLRRPESHIKIRFLSKKKSQLLKVHLMDHGIMRKNFQGEFAAMAYKWTPLSYIPWHSDGSHEVGVTIYLNKEWNADWGGLLLIKDPKAEKIITFPPTYNTAVVNDSKVEHSTTALTADAPPRLTIQCFWRE
jgi:Rps23 Pro-64 3,4-dihydroxylase Tpa1-like proline 4-hydroxylase